MVLHSGAFISQSVVTNFMYTCMINFPSSSQYAHVGRDSVLADTKSLFPWNIFFVE